ncbi:MAG TPA: glutamate synthase subunit beta [Gemmatimonadaceae bacterium]
MGDPKGFLKLRRAGPARQLVDQRLGHYQEFYNPLDNDELGQQGARCMDCGVPFCQGDTGCPVRNLIPEWNDLVFRGRWREASDVLHSTNNFPELTGRLCPAPCESACVLGLINDPVSIRTIEQAIVDRAFAEGWIAPKPPRRETGRQVAVIGSGPAGLAAAQQLRRLGHSVTVFEKSDRIGGLLRYGIPDFKLEKVVLDRRLDQMLAEGVVFKTGVDVGADITATELRARFDAVLLAGGAQIARDLQVPGRELGGIRLAMDFLEEQNRRVAGEAVANTDTAEGKHVVIIGGGDTGSDCAGVSLRQGAKSVTQFELLSRPPATRADSTPWPQWPMQLRSSHAHEEGCDRDWEVATTRFTGENGRVDTLHAARVNQMLRADGTLELVPTETTFAVQADLVLLAMGFQGSGADSLTSTLGVKCDTRGNTLATGYRTNVPGVYTAGDRRRGASLIVWAIREGRDAAAAIQEDLLR